MIGHPTSSVPAETEIEHAWRNHQWVTWVEDKLPSVCLQWPQATNIQIDENEANIDNEKNYQKHGEVIPTSYGSILHLSRACQMPINTKTSF